ncbi:MAG: heavy-metal-associated domain-containing protein [Acidimicrobiales bacterium]
MTEDVATFLVAGMHCASCGLLIDDALDELTGVRTCATDARPPAEGCHRTGMAAAPIR